MRVIEIERVIEREKVRVIEIYSEKERERESQSDRDIYIESARESERE